MPVPPKITAFHVKEALKKIKKEGVPPNRKGRKYNLIFEENDFPVIYTICIAHIFSDEKELKSNPSNFNSIHAKEYLENLGFVVETLNKNR